MQWILNIINYKLFGPINLNQENIRDSTDLQESLALAEMKAAAASREIVKNIDIKNKLRFQILYNPAVNV